MQKLIKLADSRMTECCSPVARMPSGMREEARLILKELKENPSLVSPERIKRLEILIAYKILAVKIDELNGLS
jgi:hypothetical protein